MGDHIPVSSVVVTKPETLLRIYSSVSIWIPLNHKPVLDCFPPTAHPCPHLVPVLLSLLLPQHPLKPNHSMAIRKTVLTAVHIRYRKKLFRTRQIHSFQDRLPSILLVAGWGNPALSDTSSIITILYIVLF